MKLPVYETFHSWQGEGIHTGRSAFFIRLFGCPVKCPWCDSAGTWHPKYIPEKIDRVEVENLVAQAVATKPEFVVITGGEPTIHDLTALTGALNQAGLSIHLETCGAFTIKGTFAWITLSPKWQKPPTTENLSKAHEFKIIVEDTNSIARWCEAIGASFGNKPVWLHPEWSQRNNPEVLNGITDWIKQHGAPYRAGWQIHKHYKADSTDSRAKPDASLAQ